MTQTSLGDKNWINNANLSRELSVAIDIAYKAGEIMRQYFYDGQQKVTKDDGTPLTIADTTINSMVIRELAVSFPHDGVIGEEESTTEYGMGRKWLCDPIDGTKAYTWGVPTAMFSLGLVVDGQPQSGVAYDPFLDLVYFAEKGSGAFCNGQSISVSSETLDEGVLGITSSAKELSENPPYVDKLVERGVSTATFSGAVYKGCLVARGKLAGYAMKHLTAHDLAAVHVIIEEAGGRLSLMSGDRLDYSKPFKGAIISNSVTHDDIVGVMSLGY